MGEPVQLPGGVQDSAVLKAVLQDAVRLRICVEVVSREPNLPQQTKIIYGGLGLAVLSEPA